MRKSAFTLLQVVVLVFVIFTLAAILFPFFARSRDIPHHSSCRSNLKQIALAFKQYTQDYDGKFPIVSVEPASHVSTGAPYGWVDIVQPYLKSLQIFQCPLEESQGWKLYKPWEAGYTDYYMNSRIAHVEESKFLNSSLTVMLADGNDGQDANDARYAYPSVPPAWLTDEKSPVYRHRGGANYGFVDGHVKWLRAGQAPGTEPSKNGDFTFAR
jgi:prepilin-type processing-associated H-X9-DG protein